MTDKNNANHQPINEPVFLLETTFLINAYEKWEKFEEPRMSIRFNGEPYPVYNLLYEFLISESLPLIYPQGKTIKGNDFVASYVQGYNIGMADFEKWFSPIAFQGPNADSFVNSLHRKCIHQYDSRLGGNGWIEAARKVPYEISNHMIELYGFYNALLAKYDQLVDMYKELFKKLVRCEYSDDEQEQIDNLTVTVLRKPVEVAILPKAQDRVYETLKSMVLDINEHVALSGLIKERIMPSKPITINTNQNALAYLFKTLLNKKLMSGAKTDITKWICSSFSGTTHSTVYDVFKGEENQKAPKKDSRIPIKLDDLENI